MKYFLKTSHYHMNQIDSHNFYISIIPKELVLVSEDNRILELKYTNLEEIRAFKDSITNFLLEQEPTPLNEVDIIFYGFYPHHDWAIFSQTFLSELKFSYCKNIKDISDAFEIPESEWPERPLEVDSTNFALWIKEAYFKIKDLIAIKKGQAK